MAKQLQILGQPYPQAHDDKPKPKPSNLGQSYGAPYTGNYIYLCTKAYAAPNTLAISAPTYTRGKQYLQEPLTAGSALNKPHGYQFLCLETVVTSEGARFVFGVPRTLAYANIKSISTDHWAIF